MGQVTRSTVAVRFLGDDLIPDVVSAALGARPTTSYSKGGQWLNHAGRQLTGRTGLWSLSANDCEPGDIDSQVAELFAPLSNDFDVWRDLSSRYDGDLFVGLFLTTHNGLPATEFFNEGLSIEPSTLSAIAARGLRVGFDIHAMPA